MDDEDAFWGARDRLGSWSNLRCKGTLLASRRRYLEERGGADAVQRAIGALDQPAAEMLDAPPPSSMWCDVSVMTRIDRVILDQVMEGDLATMRVFGADIARYDLNSVYRGMMRVAGERWVLRGLPVVWGLYFSLGKTVIEFSDRSRREARLRIEDICLPRYLCRYGIAGWVDASLMVAGCEAPSVEHTHCLHDGDDHCRYLVHW